MRRIRAINRSGFRSRRPAIRRRGRPRWGGRPGLFGGGALVALGIVGLFILPAVVDDSEPPTEPIAIDCFYAVGVDRSGSQDAEAIVDNWLRKHDEVLNEAAGCSATMIIETIKARPGEAQFWEGSFDVQGLNSLDAKEKRQKAIANGADAFRELATSPADGATDILGWLKAVAAHVEGLPTVPETVRVYGFTDGIQTVPPIVMPEFDLSLAGVDALMALLQPALPDCNGWEVSFTGVNITNEGGVPHELAEGAERVWRAVIGSCGGTVVRYDTTIIG